MQNQEMFSPQVLHDRSGFNLVRVLVLSTIASVVLTGAFYHEYMAVPVSFWSLQKMVATSRIETTNALAVMPTLSEQQRKTLLNVAIANSSVDTLRYLLAQSKFAEPELLAGARDMAVQALRPDMLPLLLTLAPPENPSQWAAQKLSDAAVGNGNFISHPEEVLRRLLVTRQLIELGALDQIYQENLLAMQNKALFSEMRDLLAEHYDAARKPEPPVASGSDVIAEMLEAPAEMPEVTATTGEVIEGIAP